MSKILALLVLLVGTVNGNNCTLKIKSFTLVDIQTEADISTLRNFYKASPNAKIAIRAEPEPCIGKPMIRSVLVDLDGTSFKHCENHSPYTIFGNDDGDYNGYSLDVGRHTVSATPFDRNGCRGNQGPTRTKEFLVRGPKSPLVRTPTASPSHLDCVVGQLGAECCSFEDCGAGNFLCTANKCIAKGNPRFTLTWYGNDDLDIHVITPGGVEISYRNKYDSSSNGALDHDSIPGLEGLYVENVFFPVGGGPTGIYKYFIENFNQVDTADSWTLEVYLGDRLVKTRTGIVPGNRERSVTYTFTL